MKPNAEFQADVTLLVTSTALCPKMGLRKTTVESARTADSRRVFAFERRAKGNARNVAKDWPTLEEVDDFSPVRSKDLARAGRASASFPIAFPPVQATPFMAEREKDSRATPGEYLMDGGVLDNAPFEPVLDALQKRAAHAPFQRFLLYVKPTSEPPTAAPGESSALDLRRMPGPVVAASREPDARLDIQALDDQYNLMQFTATDPSRVLLHCLKSPEHGVALTAAAQGLMWLYAPARRQAKAVPIAAPWTVGSPPDFEMTSPAVDPDIPTDLVPCNGDGQWMWGFGTAERCMKWWSRALNLEPASRPSEEAMALLGQALGAVEALQAKHPPVSDESMADILSDAAKHAAAALGNLDGEMLFRLSLAIEVVACAMRWGDDAGLHLNEFTYQEVTPAAPSLVDLSAVCEQVRPPVSPEAFASYWPSRKLYGERWGHFGAFASADGRQNDWLWGRLDGASALADMVLGGAATTETLTESLKTALLDAILQEEAAEGQSVDEMRAALLLRSADLYALDSGQLLHQLRTELTPDSRRALANLIVGLPGANLQAVAGSSPELAALLGLESSTKDRGLWRRLKLAAIAWAGLRLADKARRRLDSFLRP